MLTVKEEVMNILDYYVEDENVCHYRFGDIRKRVENVKGATIENLESYVEYDMKVDIFIITDEEGNNLFKISEERDLLESGWIGHDYVYDTWIDGEWS